MDATRSSSSPNDLIASDRVEGTVVYNTRGERLGTIDHVMIDKRSGQVAYAVLEFGGFLGLGTDRYPLPWDVLDYVPEQGGYVVPIDKDQLRDAPRHTAADRPDWNPQYGERITMYYGTMTR